MGKEDIDSDSFKVENSTKLIFIMAIGNENTSSKSNTEICKSVYDNIKLSCPNAELEILQTILEI